MNDRKIKYVDLNGLKCFAEELKKYLWDHILEFSIFNELKDRIEAIENQDFYEVVDSYNDLPKPGRNKIIYLVPENSSFLEYIWKGDTYEQLGSFTPQLSLDKYLKIEDSPFEKGSGKNSAVLKGGNNKVKGQRSLVIGNNNEVEGNNSVAEGNSCKTIYGNAHAEGNKTIAEGTGSHSEGYQTHSVASYSHTEGYNTKAYNVGEHAEGKYNKSNEGVTIHSVGIGTSDTNRKNAHEIMNDGRHFIYGIGSYDGTNAVTPNAQGIIAKSVQEVINDLVNIINEITISETN